jgi:hypothetical protein
MRNKGLVDSAVSSGPGVEGFVKRQVCATQNIYFSLQQIRGLRQQFLNSSAHALCRLAGKLKYQREKLIEDIEKVIKYFVIKYYYV